MEQLSLREEGLGYVGNPLNSKNEGQVNGSKQDLEECFQRVIKKLLLGDGCWEWQGKLSGGDYGEYGKITYKNRTRYAHAVMYERFVAPISSGMVIDHLCRNKKCGRPDHLEPVPQRTNVHRGDAMWINGAREAAKTHCKHGHQFTDENTRITSRGWRVCRTCAREEMRRRRVQSS